jgi:DNA polymerase V
MLRQVFELSTGGAATVRNPIQDTALCAGFPSPADDFLEETL